MANLRTQPRVAVHLRLIVRHAGFEGCGHTENLSERGAMISVDIEPALVPGDLLDLEFELPHLGPVTVPATVRWASAVLPGMTGIEFELPVLPELLAFIASLLGQQMAEGF